MKNQKKLYWEEETLKYNWAHARLRLIAEMIRRYPPGTSILDLGAGKALLAHMIGPSYRYHGLDIVGNIAGEAGWPQVEACDFDEASQITLPDSPYDVVVISGLLEYLEDWPIFLHYAIKQWLSMDGVCLVSFTNKKGYQSSPVKSHPEWKSVVSLHEIIEFLASNNMTMEKIYPLLWGNKYWSLPVVRILSWLADQKGQFLWLDRSWVSQFLCIVSQRN